MLLAGKISVRVIVAALALVSTLFLSACNSGSSNSISSTPVTLQSILVSPLAPDLNVTAVQQLTATGTYSDNSTRDLTASVTWSSSNTAVATVGASTGLVTPASASSALSGETVVITATSGTGSAALTASTTITLVATLTSIAVTPTDPSVNLNSSLQLTATGTYFDGKTRNVTTEVSWTSANAAVAMVGTNTGLVTPASSAAGLSGQTVVISATSGTGLMASTTITLTFDLNTVSDPLARQQWSLLNTGQDGYADATGMANTGGTLGTDLNVNPVYTTYGYTGKNVIVAVVDSGLEIAHEDLSANVVAGGSWNFINNTTDPTNTTATTGDHGTMVSGLIAMAMNGKGGIGVAPNAKLKCFNLISSSQSLAFFIASMGGSTASPNSSNVAIFNQSFGTNNTSDFPMDTTVEAQYASGTSTLRGGKGALYVKSAGNGFTSFASGSDGCALTGGAQSVGISCQNANFDPSNTLPYNIVMAALSAKGKKTSYSTTGSSIWVSTPGGEFGFNAAAITQSGFVAPATGSVYYDPAMLTTDQSGCAKGESVNTAPTGYGPFSFFNWGGTNAGGVNADCNYTNGMNGTSSAAPMMTGSIALILEANPALTWREVKDILAKTAVQVDAGNPGVTVTLSNGNYVAELPWITNAAGYNFHNWYGFGAVNVSAAVAMAKTYTSGTLGTFANTGWISSGTLSNPIPDNSTTGVPVSLNVGTVGTSGIVEEVQLRVTTVSISSGSEGDIGVELTSPSGTKSILKNIKDGLTGSGMSSMVLASNAFYGETSNGTWNVKVVDGWSGGTESLSNVQIRIYGH